MDRATSVQQSWSNCTAPAVSDRKSTIATNTQTVMHLWLHFFMFNFFPFYSMISKWFYMVDKVSNIFWAQVQLLEMELCFDTAGSVSLLSFKHIHFIGNRWANHRLTQLKPASSDCKPVNVCVSLLKQPHLVNSELGMSQHHTYHSWTLWLNPSNALHHV